MTTSRHQRKSPLRFSLPAVLALLIASLGIEAAVFVLLGKNTTEPQVAAKSAPREHHPRHERHERHVSHVEHREEPPDVPAENVTVVKPQIASTNATHVIMQQGMTFTNQLQWVQWMKKTNPQNYWNMVSNQANWRAQQVQQDEERLQTLANLDTSRMSPEEREVHETYQAVIVRQAELRELLAWENLENLSDADREALQKEQGESWQLINQCQIREREILMRDAARRLGLRRHAADRLLEEMYDAFKTTGWQLPRAEQFQ